MFKTIVALSLVAFAAAECPNACSGHGTCSQFDMCTCFRNWQANDCSQRTCPFDLAHVDTPKGDLDHSDTVENTVSSPFTITSSTVYPYGTNEMFPNVQDSALNVLTESAHAYMECSNKGICDRTTGRCECFDGYDGTACQRASCPNDCSGHGTCDTIASLANADNANIYALWDKDSTMGCSCDAGYQNADCSERQCKSGTDPLYTDDNFVKSYTGAFTFTAATAFTGSYAIKVYDVFGEDYTTSALPLTTTGTADAGCIEIDAALAALPNFAGSSISCNTAAYSQTTGGLTVYLDFANHGAIKAMEVVEYLDGKRSSVLVAADPYTYALTQWTERIGESVDYFATKCSGVTVDVIAQASWSGTTTDWAIAAGTDGLTAPIPGAIAFVSAAAPATINLLKACLGDSDGNTANNVEIYNWDYGSVSNTPSTQTNANLKYYVGAHPHAIKVADGAGLSDYVIVWWDAGQDTGFEMRAVNMINNNAAGVGGFGADDGTGGTVRTLSVYTTSGIVTQLAKDRIATYDVDLTMTDGKNETKLTGYFAAASNKIYTNFDGSCEGAVTGVHSCVEKGNLLFVVDGCWGGGDPWLDDATQVSDNHADLDARLKSEYFGGDTIGCTAVANANTGTGMIYTVTKVYTQDWSKNTTAYDAGGDKTEKGREDRFVIEVNHNIKWDGTAVGNPDNSLDTSTAGIAGVPRQWGAGFTGLVVLFKFTPATDGSEYTYFSECSNRGSCDRETGLCACFKGYTSDNCSSQSALAV